MRAAYITGIRAGGRNDPRYIVNALKVIADRMAGKVNSTVKDEEGGGNGYE